MKKIFRKLLFISLTIFLGCNNNKYSNDIISYAHPLASLAGKEIYEMGGNAFDRFKSKYPEHKLLGDDIKHQSANGTYLAACVIFSTLSNQSSKGLSYRYSGKDNNEKKIYYIFTNGSVAEKCQEIADLIVFNNE